MRVKQSFSYASGTVLGPRAVATLHVLLNVGPLSQAALMERMGIGKSMVCAVLQGLVSRGLVTRGSVARMKPARGCPVGLYVPTTEGRALARRNDEVTGLGNHRGLIVTNAPEFG